MCVVCGAGFTRVFVVCVFVIVRVYVFVRVRAFGSCAYTLCYVVVCIVLKLFVCACINVPTAVVALMCLVACESVCLYIVWLYILCSSCSAAVHAV